MTPTSCDICAFMIAPQQKEVLRVFNLVAEQEQERLKALLASVDVVPKKEVVRCWWETTHFE